MEDYAESPLIESMEVNLACGKQSTNVHSNELGVLGVIQFWKPKADKFWYDFDTLKNHLYDAIFESMNIDSEMSGPEISWAKKITNYLKGLILERRLKIYKRLVMDPDSVEKISLRG